MKRAKKSVVFLLALAVSLGTINLVACHLDEEEVDESKTQFYIGNFDGGYGHEWLDKAIEGFETKFADTSFESGKKGVQIWVVNQKDEYTGYQFYKTISDMQQSLFFTAQPRQEILDGNLIVPLDDIMDEPLTEFGESKTIREKLSSYYQDAYDMENVTFLPMSEAYFGNCVYDIDLFESKEFFFKEGGGWTSGLANDKTAGLDGVKGTYDDGLPITETDFFNLIAKIYAKGVTPLTFAGQYGAYMNAWCFNIFCNYDDGVGQKIYNTLEGEYVLYGDTEPTTFDGTNLYDAQRLPGRLKALECAYKLVKNPNNYSSEAFKSTQSQIQSQDEYLLSVDAASHGKKQIAMLIEGTWWENEALDTFNRMANSNENHSKNNRRFGLMPTFRHSAGTATKSTFLAANQMMFINANSTDEQIGVAKKFIQYVCTDEMLEMFTATTGCPSAYEYKIGQDTYNSLSNFGKNVWEIHENANDKFVIVTENRTSKAYYYSQENYPQNFESNVNVKGEEKGGATNPFTFFKYDTKNATAKDYFDGIYDVACVKYDKRYASEFGARK